MLRPLLLVLFLHGCGCLAGQPSLFDYLHQGADTVTFELDTDYKTLRRNRADKTYQPVTLRVLAGDSTWVFPGKVRTRGNFRLQVCQNPSLKIKLEKGPLLAAGFSDLNEFKIVQACTDSPTGRAYLERELSIYALHRVYSVHSHRTIPLHLRPRDESTQRAFLVEEEEQLAHRYGGQINDLRRASTRGMVRSAYVNMCLFNYLVLNTDWEVYNLHNVEVVSDTATGRYLPIPYDFDYCGFVGTSYATPHEGLGITSVHEPKWLGRGISRVEIEAGAADFLAHAGEARRLITDHPHLSDYTKKRWLRRLKRFNRELKDPKQLARFAD